MQTFHSFTLYLLGIRTFSYTTTAPLSHLRKSTLIRHHLTYSPYSHVHTSSSQLQQYFSIKDPIKAQVLSTVFSIRLWLVLSGAFPQFPTENFPCSPIFQELFLVLWTVPYFIPSYFCVMNVPSSFSSLSCLFLKFELSFYNLHFLFLHSVSTFLLEAFFTYLILNCSVIVKKEVLTKKLALIYCAHRVIRQGPDHLSRSHGKFYFLKPTTLSPISHDPLIVSPTGTLAFKR